MAFKMNGSPAKMGTISGTAGHSSALKMKAETDAASALKQKEERETSWWKGEEGFIPDELQPGVNRPKVKTEHGKAVEAKKEAEKNTKAKTTKHGTKTYKTAYKDADKGKYKTQKDFNKAADDWWASEAGQKKASAKGSKFAHRIIKKDEPTTTTKTPKGTTTRKSDGATVKKGLGAQKGKTLTLAEKEAEKAKIAKANVQIKEGKATKDKNKRDEGQLEKGKIKSGRDNAKTGTVVSRWFAKRKVKRNERQLAKRNKK